MVPGWRIGWILVHDRNGVFAKGVKEGLMKLTQLILGSNSLIQACLPAIFEQTPKEYYEDVLKNLEKHATFTCDKINQIPGLKAVVPRGAMYVMVGIDVTQFKDLKSDTEFCEKLVGEKSVFCLPGKVHQPLSFWLSPEDPEIILLSFLVLPISKLLQDRVHATHRSPGGRLQPAG